MAQFDITHPITAYSTHFFPNDAAIPVLITVYKTGSATFEDVAGYLIFGEGASSSDRIVTEYNCILKRFLPSQFAAVQTLLQHRLDHQKQPMSIHYVGEAMVGGWTTLDAGASPGLEPTLLPLVTPVVVKPVETKPTAVATKATTKKAAKKK